MKPKKKNLLNEINKMEVQKAIHLEKNESQTTLNLILERKLKEANTQRDLHQQTKMEQHKPPQQNAMIDKIRNIDFHRETGKHKEAIHEDKEVKEEQCYACYSKEHKIINCKSRKNVITYLGENNITQNQIYNRMTKYGKVTSDKGGWWKADEAYSRKKSHITLAKNGKQTIGNREKQEIRKQGNNRKVYNGYNNGNNNNYEKINNGNAKTTEETKKNEEQVKLKNHKEQEQKKNEQEKNNSEQNAEINTQSIKRNSDMTEMRLEVKKENNETQLQTNKEKITIVDLHTPSNNEYADHRNAKNHPPDGKIY